MIADSQPIIIGVGQQTWRDKDISRTPVDALQAVAAQALSDTGSERVIEGVDCIVHVPFLLTQVPELAAGIPRNAGAAAAERLGITAPIYSAETGGNLPQALVTEFAARLQRGECRTVLLFGAELLATFLGALRSGQGFPEWSTGREDSPEPIGKGLGLTSPIETAHGLFEPINTYPLFESALRHAKGLDAEAHRQRIAGLVSDMSQVAAANPFAWKQRHFSVEEVLSTENGNRLISHPYTKLMNAIIGVDQAAAVVLSTVGEARRLGIDPRRWIYLRGAATTHDTASILERESYHRSEPLELAARAALTQSGLTLPDVSLIDLYSCFPSAVQVAADALGLQLDDPRGLTVTGGMTIFGAPGNNYTLHAIAEMVAGLREAGHGAGIVTANGGYLTKHSIGVYATEPGTQVWTPLDDAALQAGLDSRLRPRTVELGRGEFEIEAHTVRYSGGEATSAIAVGKLNDGSRCVAVSDDPGVVSAMLTQDCVGVRGNLTTRDGLNQLGF